MLVLGFFRFGVVVVGGLIVAPGPSLRACFVFLLSCCAACGLGFRFRL